MEKFYGIQYLRGFAAVYVMLFHMGSLCGVHLTGTGGRTARLFFVISGFIITWTFRRTTEPPIQQLQRYAIRRATRIYPPYWIVLAFTAPLFIFGFAKGDWWHRDPVNIIQNFFLTQPPGQNILFVSWSLVYEMFFYCLFGFVVILMGIPITVVCAIWAAVIVGVHFLLPGQLPKFLITSSYNLYFIAGCLLAEYHRKKPIRCPWQVFMLLLIAYILLPYFTLSEAIALFFSILLVASSLGCFLDKPHPFFLLLGEASYSIYLVHGIAGIITFRLTHEKIPYLLLVAVAFSVSMCFYFFVEKPILKSFRVRGKKALQPGEIKVAPVP
jgi:exopolysaccharide production protein ExoZ